MVGNKDSRCGKILCKMTGGTSGPKEIYSKLSEAGVGTVIGMHFPEEHLKEARENNVNIIISGHMSSDSVGINLICDIWEREGIKMMNDILYVRSDILDEMYFVVYNRWGEKLFETVQQEIGWDGTFKKKDCQTGVYDYYFKGKCKDGDELELKGNVTLIR